MRADQIMSPRVIAIDPEASIVEAANLMLKHHVSGLPVVNRDGELVGIVSEEDFVRRAEIGTQRRRNRWLELLISSGRSAAEFIREHGRKVKEVMTPNPITISEATPLDEIAQMMESGRIRRLPVLRGNRLVGMVTRSNLVQAVAQFAQDIPAPSADDDRIRHGITAIIENAKWSPSRLNVMVNDGVVTLYGLVTNQRSRQAAVVAAENMPGVRKVQDCLNDFPDPEEDLGGGDLASLEHEPPTNDDAPL